MNEIDDIISRLNSNRTFYLVDDNYGAWITVDDELREIIKTHYEEKRARG